MAEPMSPERLAEIHETDRRDYADGQIIRRRPQSAIAQRRELLAEVARLTADLAKAEAAIARINQAPLHRHDTHWCLTSRDITRALGDAAPPPTGEQIGALLARLADRADQPTAATSERDH